MQGHQSLKEIIWFLFFAMTAKKGHTMITAIRPYTPQNRQQQNFKQIPTNIADNAPEAYKFLLKLQKGTQPFDKEKDAAALFSAIDKAKINNELGAVSYLEDAVEFLKLKPSSTR